MLYNGYVVYGPYLCKKDGRLRVILYKDRCTTTVSYPKFLMENHLNRYLSKDEVVHHKDENPLNNEMSNLEVITRPTHTRMHATKDKWDIFICPYCKKDFELKGKRLNAAIQNRRQGKFGPFCSKRCVGKWSTGQVIDQVNGVKFGESGRMVTPS